MQDAFSRMELLVGNTGVKKLSMAKIAVFGLGGAGAQAAEALARCGVGSLTLFFLPVKKDSACTPLSIAFFIILSKSENVQIFLFFKIFA